MEPIMSTEFASALCKALSAMGGVTKNKTNPAFRSSYADLAATLEVINEPLSSNDISLLMPLVNTEENKIGVKIQLVYGKTGEMHETDPFFVPISKPDAQGYIAASTYARRCFATSYFCLPTEDDDGNTASGTKVPPQQQSRPVAAPPKPPTPPVQSKPELKVVAHTPSAPTEQMATQENVDNYLAKWDASYPDGKSRPSVESLLKLKRAELVAEYNLLPVVMEAKKAKEAK